MILCSIFLVVECVGGILSGSLAILSDAAHLCSDVAALGVALAASHLAASPPTAYHTYGLQRVESLAALVSMVTLVLVCVYLAGHAVVRGYHMLRVVHDSDTAGGEQYVYTYVIDGPLMSGIAAVGVVVNIVLAIVLGGDHVHLPGSSHDHDHSHHHHHDNHATCDAEQPTETSTLLHKEDSAPKKKQNVNLHAAYLHVLGDLLQSLAVLVTGFIVWWNPAYGWIDPVITLLFCLIVVHSTVGVVRSSLSVLLDAVPPHVDWRTLHQKCTALPSVASVHDLHIWSVADGVTAATLHAVTADGYTMEQALCDVHAVCCTAAGGGAMHAPIQHLTVQVQPSHMPDCVTCPSDTGTGTTGASQHRCVVYTEDDDDNEKR